MKYFGLGTLFCAIFLVAKTAFAAEPPPMPSLPPSAPETGTTTEEAPTAPAASTKTTTTTAAAETTSTGPETGLVILLSVLGAGGLFSILKKR